MYRVALGGAATYIEVPFSPPKASSAWLVSSVFTVGTVLVRNPPTNTSGVSTYNERGEGGVGAGIFSIGTGIDMVAVSGEYNVRMPLPL